MTFSDPAIEMAHRSAIRSIERVVAETVEPAEPGAALDYVVSMLGDPQVLVLTGAGVSTESGIPDYRSENGRLSQGRPMTYQEFAHAPEAVRRYWARAFVGIRYLRTAAPNRTHFALVELERAGLVSAIITQNVDGLHREAGSARVIELHGNMGSVSCLDCGVNEERTLFDARLTAANPHYAESVRVTGSMLNPDGDVELRDGDVERFRMISCRSCGGQRLKPSVVYFGESVPRRRRDEAARLLAESTGVIALGTSLAVMSGYKIVLDALAAHKPVAVINGGPGRADPKVPVVWRTGVGDALDAVLDSLEL
ncbi:Sir2 family NAD-dependent protein deacetylase [Corynebacterium liangguodongii]|uniref:protein acetyllysine N-acetyltransferase n=1 Tax=Corynebacterium liangguodongii TaxID=2079535 RepID=A0A2S0WBI5_9CORY|nr:Sir2 family NAD-dependent protein deacetylase [Corynebacterium liangguodongii]AWB83129.1 NAD-dependent protein deacetylase [Corynebacterium liangguodongii]PWB99270.1 NAD-dependent protein deacetylase [Corynebacterium liangguodongii]